MQPEDVRGLEELEGAVLDDSIPLAQALRRCLILGGYAHHQELRQWAQRELTGYGPDDELPAYRTVPAALAVNVNQYSLSGIAQFSGHRISHHQLPEAARNVGVGERMPIHEGVKALEEMVARSRGPIHVSPPGAAEYVVLMNRQQEELGGPGTEITSLHWEVATPVVEGVLDQIRTRLARFVAEMRAQMPAGQQNPNPAQVDRAARQAFDIKTGSNSPVTINANTASADRGGTANANTNEPAPAPVQPWFHRSTVLWSILGVVVAAIAIVVPLIVSK
ncbi:AbiTii domain-containing protein [Kitasatospora purpeofusca]|uniref:AbiTii domain-containing protein n=1 Tax=Kitasatospora purpeofusca TaxID=67352 RepID=UPI00365F2458